MFLTADSKLSSLTALVTPASGDLLYIVDSSDTTQSDSGTSKQITYGNLFSLSGLGVTASAAELNILDGATLTTAELNYVDGVTSAIQTQINLKAPLASPTFTGTVTLPVALSGIAKLTSGVVSVVTAPSGAIVGTTDTQALSNKTLTTPIIVSIYQDAGKTKLMTLPNTASDTLAAIAATQTLTNKRITKRVTTIASNATPTVNTDNCDVVTITALATAITSMTTNLSGTPTNFQTLIYRILDNGTGRAITWGATFQAMGVALPTTTTSSKVLTVGFLYDTVDSKWGCVASVEEA